MDLVAGIFVWISVNARQSNENFIAAMAIRALFGEGSPINRSVSVIRYRWLAPQDAPRGRITAEKGKEGYSYVNARKREREREREREKDRGRK